MCFSAFGEQIGWGLVRLGAPRRQARGCSAVDVVEDLADEVGIGDVCDDPQLSAAQRAECDHRCRSRSDRTNTRFNRCAQVSGAVGGSLQSLRNFVDEHGRVGGAAAESSSFLRRRARAGVGTIARRIGEFGAKTPW